MKNVLVTGGNKGIGLAICSGILRDHADIAILLGSRDASRGEEAVKGIIEKNPGAEGRVSMLLIDTSSDESVQAAAASFAASHGVSPPPLWAIVNNAGIVDSKSTDSMLQVNTMGPIRVNEAFAHLIQTDGGRIVNISSGAGPGFVGKLPKDLQPIFTDPAPTMEGTKNLIKSHFGTTTYGPGMTGYGLSKALVNVYTRAHALTSPGMKINACTPGFIATDLTNDNVAPLLGAKPKDLGMKTVEESTVAPFQCLFGNVGTGNYYGSDGVRSPLDYMRDPGAPAYDGP